MVKKRMHQCTDDIVADLARVAQTRPDECIISIEEIVNPVLQARYDARKTELALKGAVVERRVFHGSRGLPRQ
jgi:hypothetical protein